MFSIFKSSKNSGPLDQYLVRYLAGTYQMGTEETDKLHFVTKNETLASQKVTMFRIFDPTGTNSDDAGVKFDALDDQRSALQFEGRFAKNKTVTEIRDLRTAE